MFSVKISVTCMWILFVSLCIVPWAVCFLHNYRYVSARCMLDLACFGWRFRAGRGMFWLGTVHFPPRLTHSTPASVPLLAHLYPLPAPAPGSFTSYLLQSLASSLHMALPPAAPAPTSPQLSIYSNCTGTCQNFQPNQLAWMECSVYVFMPDFIQSPTCTGCRHTARIKTTPCKRNVLVSKKQCKYQWDCI